MFENNVAQVETRQNAEPALDFSQVMKFDSSGNPIGNAAVKDNGGMQQMRYNDASVNNAQSQNQAMEMPSLWTEHVNPTRAQYRNAWVSDILDRGNYHVEKGDTLNEIARRSLGVSGHAGASAREIAHEAKRIAALNDLPLDKKGHPRLTPGMVLDV